MCTANTLVRAVRSHVAAATLQKHITGLIESEKTEVIEQAALTIASNDDKDAKNAELSVLRTQIARACESLGIEKHTVKGKDMKFVPATKQKGSGRQTMTPADKVAKAAKDLSDPKEVVDAIAAVANCNLDPVQAMYDAIMAMPQKERDTLMTKIVGKVTSKKAA